MPYTPTKLTPDNILEHIDKVCAEQGGSKEFIRRVELNEADTVIGRALNKDRLRIKAWRELYSQRVQA